jgi:hypothetical protein
MPFAREIFVRSQQRSCSAGTPGLTQMTARGPRTRSRANNASPLSKPADPVPPFTSSDQVWQTLASASLTVIDGQKDRCLILQHSAKFVCKGEDLDGAQRLAVLAVDFSHWSSRSSAGVAVPCAAHGKPSLLS